MVVALRYLIVVGWVVGVVAAIRYLPPLTQSSGVTSLVPGNTAALRAEATATRIFGEPLDAPVAVVQRAARGLSASVQEAAVRNAVAIDTGRAAPISGLAGALPILNTDRIFPGSRERSTTIVTFLYFRPSAATSVQVAGGQTYARRFASARSDHFVGVTGAVPALYEQGVIISQRLPWVELATVLAIAVIVGFFFLSPGAPLATLACAGTAYLISVRVVAWVMQEMHVTLPPDVEPVLIVLLLGVTTDYSVFFMSGMRHRLAEGRSRLQAAQQTTAEYAPIILAAGILVAAGTASLSVAHLQLIRALGPALAVTVLTAMVVALTLAPALTAIAGSALLLPGPAWYRRARRQARAAAAERAAGFPARVPRPPWRGREAVARFTSLRPIALVIAAACVLALLAAALLGAGLRVGAPLVTALPASAQPARAQAAAASGFAAGLLSPTEVMVLGPRVGSRRAALDRLQHELARQPGVAGVVGPASVPAVLARQADPMVAKSGGAARYGVIYRTDPLGPTAVSQVQALSARLPQLAPAAGLADVRIELGGETAAVGETIHSMTSSLGELALIMLAVTFVLLALFLRALLAPVYLLAASVLALAATLGVTVWVFQHRLGYDGLVYYVPFTVAVLLISLGADYNVFVVGRIWEEARRRVLRDAIAVASTQASRAVGVAGITLASSFALLALIPLQQFREVALAMAAGVIIDAIVARSLLVPALVALFGRVGMWPGSPPPLRERGRGQLRRLGPGRGPGLGPGRGPGRGRGRRAVPLRSGAGAPTVAAGQSVDAGQPGSGPDAP